jgi:2-polyprenyl-3-methyl-5-hydroxy-6-metoxy-1,4-benzoquinol methylase
MQNQILRFSEELATLKRSARQPEEMEIMRSAQENIQNQEKRFSVFHDQLVSLSLILNQVQSNTGLFHDKAELLSRQYTSLKQEFANYTDQTQAQFREVRQISFSLREELHTRLAVLTHTLDQVEELKPYNDQQKVFYDQVNQLQAQLGNIQQASVLLQEETQTQLATLTQALTQATTELNQQCNRNSELSHEKIKSLSQEYLDLKQAFTRQSDRIQTQHRVLEQIVFSLKEETHPQFEALTRTLTQTTNELDHQLTEIKVRLQRAERKGKKIEQTPKPFDAVENGGAPAPLDTLKKKNGHALTNHPSLADSSAEILGLDYFLFEHRFRGTRAEIRERQKIYLPEFQSKKHILDMGCGRGEFLSLMKEMGARAIGVDCDEDMVDLCKELGLNAIQSDIFEYLQTLPNESLDGIFSAQFIEHITPKQLFHLLELCGNKLRPGGVIALETVNTNCPMALSNFYLDPTHVRPVPPDLLRHLLENDTFEFRCLRFSSPARWDNVPTFQDLLSGFEVVDYQDYAAIATKR